MMLPAFQYVHGPVLLHGRHSPVAACHGGAWQSTVFLADLS